MYNIFSIIIAIFFLSIQTYSSANEVKIGKIEFIGNEKTSNEVLNAVIKIKSGDILKIEELEKSVQYLKNTTVFSEVNLKTEIDSNKKVVNITFNLSEKWTTNPYFLFGTGGGSSYYTLGLIDTNFLGKLYNFQIAFTMMNGKPNGSIGFKNEQTFNLPLVTQILSNYSDKKIIMYSKNNQENGYFSYKILELNPSFLWKISDYLRLGLGINFQKARKINEELTSIDYNINKQNNIIKPNPFETTALQFKFELGKINYEGITQEGIHYSSITNTTFGFYKDSSDYTDSSQIIRAFYRPAFDRKSNLAYRLIIKATTSYNPIKQFYFGGLYEIRGFNDNQFFGRFGILSNLEYRYTVWQGEYIAVQVIPFIDAVLVSPDLHNIFCNNQTASSVGLSFSVPLVKVNELAFTFGYAKAMSPFANNWSYYFNLVQFF